MNTFRIGKSFVTMHAVAVVILLASSPSPPGPRSRGASPGTPAGRPCFQSVCWLDPSSIQATRLASECIRHLIDQAMSESPENAFVGVQSGKIRFTPLSEFPEMVDAEAHRPHEQGWLELRSVARVMSAPQKSG